MLPPSIQLVAVTRPEQNPQRLLVCRGAVELGFIEKYKPEPGYVFPWKAFHGIGYQTRYVGAFFGPKAKADAVAAAVRGLPLAR